MYVYTYIFSHTKYYKRTNSNSNAYVIILLKFDIKISLAIEIKPCRWAVPHAGLGKS